MTKPNARRRERAAKVYAYAIVMDAIDSGVVLDAGMENELRSVMLRVLCSVSDRYTAQAEDDLRRWRETGWTDNIDVEAFNGSS